MKNYESDRVRLTIVKNTMMEDDNMQEDSNLWVMITDSTPVALRWLLTILTLGLFWLVSFIVKRYHERFERLEEAQIQYITRSELKEILSSIDSNLERIHTRFDQVLLKLDDESTGGMHGKKY